MADLARRLAASRERSALARWAAASNTARTLRALRVAPETAAVTRAARTLAAWTRASFLYRWLTKEPEPEVIVIDLRDTYTVGPFIALLDWLIDRLAPAYRRSRVRAAGVAVADTLWSVPVRVASVAVLLSTLGWLARRLGGGPVSASELAPAIGLLIASAAGTQVRISGAALADTRLVRWLRRALEPPEPVEGESDPAEMIFEDRREDDRPE